MKSMRARARLLASSSLSLVAWFTGCTGTETGNPDISQVSLHLVSSAPERISLDAGGGATELDVHSLELFVSRFALLACNEAEEIVAENQIISWSNSQSFSVTEGTYCGLVIESAPDTGEVSLKLEGQLADERSLFVEAPAPTSFFLLPNPDSSAVDASAFEIQAGTNLLLTIDVAQLFLPGQLSDVAGETTVTVSNTENDWLLDSFLTGWQSSVALHIDADGDGNIDPGSVPVMTSR